MKKIVAIVALFLLASESRACDRVAFASGFGGRVLVQSSPTAFFSSAFAPSVVVADPRVAFFPSAVVVNPFFASGVVVNRAVAVNVGARAVVVRNRGLFFNRTVVKVRR